MTATTAEKKERTMPTTPLTLTDGRWTNPATTATAAPPPCASCGYRGAMLRPHRGTGAMVCSVCDSSVFPPVPEELADAAFDAREQLPPHVIPTDIEGWVRQLARYLSATRPSRRAVLHGSPTTGLLRVIL